MKRRSFIGSILAAVATPVLAKVAPTTPLATLLVSDDKGMTWSDSQNIDIDFYENENVDWEEPKVKQNGFSGMHGRGNMTSIYFVDESPFMPQT